MPVVSFTVFPVSVLKTLQVIRCTWWGLAFLSNRGKQSKSVTSEKVLALRGFECGGVSIWVLTSPHGRGRVQPLCGRRESMRQFHLPSVQSASSRGRCKVPSSGVQESWSDVSVPIPYLQSRRDEGREQGCLHGMQRMWVSRFLVAPIAGLADGPVG